MVVRLRFAPELWDRVSRRQPDFDRKLEDFINQEPAWILSVPEITSYGNQRRATVHHVMQTREFQFHLQKSRSPDADYDIVQLRNAEPKPDGEVLTAQVEDEIQVLRPEKPAQGTPNGIVFIVDAHKYQQLPAFQRGPLNAAWNRARRGRIIRRVFYDGEAIFTLTRNGPEASTALDAENLDAELQDSGTGRFLTDSYELKRARQLTEKYGETLANGV